MTVTITTLSSRQFNENASRAKKSARNGPVFITDRGRPSHVLLTIEAYRDLMGSRADVIEMLAMPGTEDVEFEPPRRQGEFYRPADLT